MNILTLKTSLTRLLCLFGLPSPSSLSGLMSVVALVFLFGLPRNVHAISEELTQASSTIKTLPQQSPLSQEELSLNPDSLASEGLSGESLKSDVKSQIIKTKNILNEMHLSLKTTQDSLQSARNHLAALRQAHEVTQKSIRVQHQKDSLQLVQINQLNQQLDSLKEAQADVQVESQTWKSRFLWQLPFTIGLFLIGFGIGGGHFP